MAFHNELVCCVAGCGGLICLTPEQEAKLRSTHEYFRCPFGHRQHFTGKTAEQRQIESLEGQVASWRRRYDDRTALVFEALGAHRECPLGCGWRSRKSVKQLWGWNISEFMGRVRADVAAHLAEEHGAELPPDPAESEQTEAPA